MEPTTPVQAFALADISKRLQQVMSRNRSNLEKAGIWEFLLWVRDVERVVNDKKVTQFVHTYQLKTKTAMVDGVTVDFSTLAISQAFSLKSLGSEEPKLEDLTKAEAETIFEYKFRWGKETKWAIALARNHWSMWFDFVNNYFLFRPEEAKMEQKYVVAAIRAWEGKQVNWPHIIQHRINEEIQVRKAQKTPVLFLYSAFYISCLCDFAARPEEVTPPRVSPVRRMLSPPSPTSEEIEAQYMQMRVSVAELNKQLMEKQGKLELAQEKNAEYLQQVNQLLQDKLNDQRQCTELRMENSALKVQLTELRQDYTRLQKEGSGRVALRPLIMERSSNTMDYSLMDPSTSTVPLALGPVSVEGKFLADEVCTKLWEVESKIVLNFNLHQFYEIHRDLLFTMTGYELGDVLDRTQFFELWAFCEKFKVENLLTEVLVRKHLQLSDPFSAFIRMGDMGGRIYLYYAECEERLHQRRSLRRLTEGRTVDWADYSVLISQQFYNPGRETVVQWKNNLESVAVLVKDEDYLDRVLGYSLRRVYNSDQVDDFTATHYLYNREKAVDRIDQYLQAMEEHRAPVLAVQPQVEFCLAPPGYRPHDIRILDMPVEGSPANQRYLGHYRELFDDEGEKPIPTWPALAWILEDYGLSRSETVPADKVYRQQSRAWSFEPPPAVQLHPQYCPCARRHKWAPEATIASVEYNWPQVQGAPGFNTPGQCRDAYLRFFEEHKTHKDPVCFRAAVFCAALAEWCTRWNFAINVNYYHESRQEFFMLLKLQFRPSRWLRMVEAMAITHFIEGVHSSFINEFPYTRVGPFERYLKWQRTNNPHFVAQDEDLQRALLVLQAKESRQPSGSRSRSQMREGEEDDTEGSSIKRLRIGRDANQ